MTDPIPIILAILLALAMFCIPLAFIAGYLACHIPTARELKRLDPLLTTHVGMTAQRLNYKIPTNEVPQQDETTQIAHQPSISLFARRQEAIEADAQDTNRKAQGLNAAIN